jgi:hypothetical protein
MEKLFKVTYDSENGSCFKVHTPSGIAVFKQCKKGLHYLDMSKLDQDALCFVTTINIKEQFKGCTKKEVVNAIKARRLQGMIGGPPTEAFEGVVCEKLIDKCPVALSDLKNAQNIFGPDLAGLRGRTVRQKHERVEPDLVEILRDFCSAQKSIVLTADVIFVSGYPFLLT